MVGMEPTSPKLIRIAAISQMVGVSRRTLYRLMEFNDFPQPTMVRGCACWSLREVEAWISKQLVKDTRARRSPVRVVEIPMQAYEALRLMARDGETPSDVIARLAVSASAPSNFPTTTSSPCAR